LYVKYYSSSTITKKAELGTIENDACGNFGKFEIEDFRGKKIFDILINKEFNSILDIGAGEMKATEAFINKNKIVDICDFDNSYYYKKNKIDKIDKINKKYIGDLLLLNKFFPIDIKEDSFNGDIMNLNI
tara:strand:+ start:41 stop:430 length:390 start_codon:yes stop_codon:yes gene_type:complete